MKSNPRLLAVSITLAALLVSPLLSQANYGSLSGTVKDQSGAGDLPPGTSPLSKLDLGPFEVSYHQKVCK